MRLRPIIFVGAAAYTGVVVALAPLGAAKAMVGRTLSVPGALDALVQDLNDNLEGMSDAYR